MVVLLDSVAVWKHTSPGARRNVRAHRPGIHPRATAAACRQPAWQAMAGPPPGPRRHPVEVAHRQVMAGYAPAVRAVADLLWPAAPLAAGRDLAQSVGDAGRRRIRLTPRSPRPGGVAGGASGSGAHGPGGGAATTTTTAPAAPLAASTTPGRSVGGAPPRSRSPPGPTRVAVEVLAVSARSAAPLSGMAAGGSLCAERRQERLRDHHQADVPIPAIPAADLVVVQADLVLGLLEGLFDGLITNGKFCCTRRVRLGLSWWHRPLRLRRSGLQTDAVLVGEPDEPDLDRLPPVQPPPRRRPSLGSGLPAAGALDSRARRRHPAGGAEGTGGA